MKWTYLCSARASCAIVLMQTHGEMDNNSRDDLIEIARTLVIGCSAKQYKIDFYRTVTAFAWLRVWFHVKNYIIPICIFFFHFGTFFNPSKTTTSNNKSRTIRWMVSIRTNGFFANIHKHILHTSSEWLVYSSGWKEPWKLVFESQLILSFME